MKYVSLLIAAFLLTSGIATATPPTSSIHPYLMLPDIPKSNAASKQTITCELTKPCSLQFGFAGDIRWENRYTFDKPITVTTSWKVYAYDLSNTSLSNIHSSDKVILTRTSANPNVSIPFSIDTAGEYIGTFTFTDPETLKTDSVSVAIVAEDNKVWINHTFTNIFYGITDIPQRLKMLGWRHKKSREMWVNKLDFKTRQEVCGRTFHSTKLFFNYLNSEQEKKDGGDCHQSSETFREQIKNYSPELQKTLLEYISAKFYKIKNKVVEKNSGASFIDIPILPYTPIRITAEPDFPIMLEIQNDGASKNALGKADFKTQNKDFCPYNKQEPVCQYAPDGDGKLRIIDVIVGDQFTIGFGSANPRGSEEWSKLPNTYKIKITIEELDEIPGQKN